MVRHGKQRKLRSGRKVSGSGGKAQKHRTLRVLNALKDNKVKEHWDKTKSPANNLNSYGLIADPNTGKHKKPESALVGYAQLKPALEDLNPKRRLMSEVDQRYANNCMKKYGEDFKAMERDIITNDRQLSSAQMKKVTSMFATISRTSPSWMSSSICSQLLLTLFTLSTWHLPFD